MASVSPTSKTLVREFILRARAARVDHVECVGRAAQILQAIEPELPHSVRWRVADELVAEALVCERPEGRVI